MRSFYTKGLNKFFNIQQVCSFYKSCTLHNILLIIIMAFDALNSQIELIIFSLHRIFRQ